MPVQYNVHCYAPATIYPVIIVPSSHFHAQPLYCITLCQDPSQCWCSGCQRHTSHNVRIVLTRWHVHNMFTCVHYTTPPLSATMSHPPTLSLENSSPHKPSDYLGSARELRMATSWKPHIDVWAVVSAYCLHFIFVLFVCACVTWFVSKLVERQ